MNTYIYYYDISYQRNEGVLKKLLSISGEDLDILLKGLKNCAVTFGEDGKVVKGIDDLEEKTKIMIELARGFYQSYFRADNEGKVQIIKKLMIELFIDNKKELRVEESPLFQSSKMLLNSFGTLTENGTPISALRRPHPNH